jgi:hypothetical protein
MLAYGHGMTAGTSIIPATTQCLACQAEERELMRNVTLKDWMEANDARLRSFGYSMTFKDYPQGQTSLDLDSAEFMARITCWPNGKCELQFHSTQTGDVLFLIPEVELDGDHLIKVLEERHVI